MLALSWEENNTDIKTRRPMISFSKRQHSVDALLTPAAVAGRVAPHSDVRPRGTGPGQDVPEPVGPLAPYRGGGRHETPLSSERGTGCAHGPHANPSSLEFRYQ